jgi:hypothetical protein
MGKILYKLIIAFESIIMLHAIFDISKKFTPDEPISKIIATAKQIPDVKFFITGDYNRINNKLLTDCNQTLSKRNKLYFVIVLKFESTSYF